MIRERSDGTVVADGHGIEVHERPSLPAAFEACGGDEVVAVANAEVGERAWPALLARLQAILQPPPRE